MIRYPLPETGSVTRFDHFLHKALTDITGEEIPLDNISDNKDMISFLSQKIALDTGLDSCDIAQWLSTSLKQYWVEVELPG